MRQKWKLLALALVVVAPASAMAGTATTNMTVGITVTSACSLTVTDINFGTVPATTLASALTSTAAMGGLLSYNCATAPTLSAGQGKNYSSSNRMIGAVSGSFIPYSLNLPTLSAATGAQTAQITATIPAQSNLPTGDSYTDQVVLTLTY